MNKKKSAQSAGFIEREHTADWELEVYAPDLPGLLEQAARGMYKLMGTQLQKGKRVKRDFELTILDEESLIVDYLSELLYITEQENLAFDKFSLQVLEDKLSAELYGSPIRSMDKEIKAVTYHKLNIHRSEDGLRANIVFDV